MFFSQYLQGAKVIGWLNILLFPDIPIICPFLSIRNNIARISHLWVADVDSFFETKIKPHMDVSVWSSPWMNMVSWTMDRYFPLTLDGYEFPDTGQLWFTDTGWLWISRHLAGYVIKFAWLVSIVAQLFGLELSLYFHYYG